MSLVSVRAAPEWAAIPPRVNIVAESLERSLAAGLHDKTAFISPLGCLTYAELNTQVNAFAAACAERGIARGDRVLIRMWNCLEFPVAFLALAKIGAVPVTQNSAASLADVSFVLDHSDAVAAIALADLAEPLRALRDKLPKGLIIARGAAGGEAAFEDLIKSGSIDTADTSAEDPAMMCYTSGTTGQPKGIVHAHRWIIARGDANRARLPPEPNDVVMAAGEWSFISLLGHNVLFVLRNGVTGAVLEGRASPEKLLQTIADFRVTVSYAVPTLYRRTLAMEGVEKQYDLSSLRACNASGEALGASTFDAWKRRVGVPIFEHYGVSEMQLVISQSPLMPVKPGSVGKPWGVRAAVLDDEGRPVPRGTVGQLVLDADNPSLFLGYHKDPAKTAETVHGGWLFTGDLAREDEDGYFWIAGRNDDCFKSRGIFIAPIEIESALLEHPAVAEACVVPQPDAHDGYLIRAVVVARDPSADRSALTDELRTMLRNKVARTKVPQIFDFVEALPKSAVGKVLRRSLAPKKEK